MIARVTVTANVVNVDEKFVKQQNAVKYLQAAVDEALNHAMNRGFNCIPGDISVCIEKVEKTVDAADMV
jgi:hypothetical protein